MILVLFEVTIKKQYVNDYLALAANLKHDLVKNEGFIRSERFSSLVNEGKLLSLSVWKSEEAVNEWRNHIEHRMNQRQGRDTMFESYTITVAAQLRSYSQSERAEVPEDSKRLFD